MACPFPLTIAAHKLYPLRVRVVNALTKEDEWHTIAFIPQILTERGSAGAERSRLRRMVVLQRVLYLALRSLIIAGEKGVPFRNSAGEYLLAFPRILLYLCDQPEERAVLCLKPGMCNQPCSLCDVRVQDLGTTPALHAKDKHPLQVVPRQLEAHGHRSRGREQNRRAHLERELSINCQPPVLAAMAGLCTPPFLLYKIFALDVLHVRFFFLTASPCVMLTPDECFLCVLWSVTHWLPRY